MIFRYHLQLQEVRNRDKILKSSNIIVKTLIFWTKWPNQATLTACGCSLPDNIHNQYHWQYVVLGHWPQKYPLEMWSHIAMSSYAYCSAIYTLPYPFMFSRTCYCWNDVELFHSPIHSVRLTKYRITNSSLICGFERPYNSAFEACM